jgi:hypothetical protein
MPLELAKSLIERLTTLDGVVSELVGVALRAAFAGRPPPRASASPTSRRASCSTRIYRSGPSTHNFVGRREVLEPALRCRPSVDYWWIWMLPPINTPEAM